jgi:Tfp pilus assembly major pilin PilA
MRNKKLVLGIAAGAAALAGAAVYAYRKRAQKREFADSVEEAKHNMKGKLDELKRKAKKEYKNSEADVKSAMNDAKQRANEWVNRANA